MIRRELKQHLRALFRRKSSPRRSRRVFLEALEDRRLLTANFDVWIDSLEAPSKIWPGESMEIRWTVGAKRTSAIPTISHSIYLSQDEVLSHDDLELSGVESKSDCGIGTEEMWDVRTAIQIPDSRVGQQFLIVEMRPNPDDEPDNNTWVQEIEIGEPRVDLQILELVAPSIGVIGTTQPVTWAITNAGSGTTAFPRIQRLYLSSDDRFDPAGDKPVADTWSDDPLTANQKEYGTARVIVPDVPPGQQFLLLVADAENSQRESNESNNFTAFPFEVRATSSGLPDLMFSAISTPEEIVEESNQTFTVLVTNQGGSSTEAYQLINVYVSSDETLDGADRILAAAAVSSLGPGETSAQSISTDFWHENPGDYFVIFEIKEGSHYQPESDKANNVVVRPLRIIPAGNGESAGESEALVGPDLKIVQFSVPSSAMVGEQIAVSWTVENVGNETIVGRWQDHVEFRKGICHSPIWLTNSVDVDSVLEPGENYTQTVVATIRSWFPRGDAALIITLDASNAVTEADEDNNTIIVPFRVQSADLEVIDAVAPSAAIAGQTIELAWTVQNSGDATTEERWYDAIYFSSDENFDEDDQLLLERPGFYPLSPGASYNRTAELLVTNVQDPGFLLFKTNRFSFPHELTFWNNVRAVPFTVSDGPDLVVTSFSAPAEVVPGKTFEVTWSVTNQGNVATNSPWSESLQLVLRPWELLVDEWQVGEFRETSDQPLLPDETRTRTVQHQIPAAFSNAGDFQLLLKIDSKNEQGELDDENNDSTAPVHVSLPDLIVSSVSGPAEAPAGSSINVAWTVLNDSTVPALAYRKDAIYLSGDAKWDVNDRVLYADSDTRGAPLDPGESEFRSTRIMLPEGVVGECFLIFLG